MDTDDTPVTILGYDLMSLMQSQTISGGTGTSKMAMARPPWPGNLTLFITIFPAASDATSEDVGSGGLPALKGSSEPWWM